MKPSDYHEALAEIERLNGQLAECYRLSGADPDGNEDSMLAPHAVKEVKRLREETDAEVERLQCENTGLQKKYLDLQNQFVRYQHETFAPIQQERDRLREALESIEPIWWNQQMSTLAVAKAMLDLAKQALAAKETR